MMVAEQPRLRGVMLHDEPMAKHTSWRVGGPADRYYQPADVADLCAFLAQLPALQAENRSMMFFLMPFLDRVIVEFRHYHDGDISRPNRRWSRFSASSSRRK